MTFYREERAFGSAMELVEHLQEVMGESGWKCSHLSMERARAEGELAETAYFRALSLIEIGHDCEALALLASMADFPAQIRERYRASVKDALVVILRTAGHVAVER